MTKYKQVLNYRSLGYSQRQISDILEMSRNTVAKIFKAADSCDVDWIKASQMSEELTSLLFPKAPKKSMYQPP